MWTYKGVVSAVNYSVEVKIPVNTKVKINDICDDVIEFQLEDSQGARLEMLNIPKYSRLTTRELAECYFN
jgi:hypothetical protein